MATILGRGGSRPGETYWTQPKAPAKTTPAKKTTSTPAKTATQTTNNAISGTGSRASDTKNITTPETEAPAWLGSGPSWNTGGGGNYANDYYSDALKRLEDQRRAQEEEQRRRTQQTIDSINANIPRIDQDYEDQQRQNYISHTQNMFGLPDYLKAMGHSGGMSETEGTRLTANYQNARNTADQNKNNAMQQIADWVAQARTSGDTSLAQIASDYFTQYSNMAKEQAQQQAEYDRWQAEYNMRQSQTAKDDYMSLVGAYGNDYQAEINKLLAAGYSPDSYQVKALQQARNQKLSGIASQQKEDEQQAFQNDLALQRLYKSNSGSTGSGMNKNEAYASDYTQAANGMISPEAIRANMQALIAQYGVNGYNELLMLAEDSYKSPYAGSAGFRVLAGEQ